MTKQKSTILILSLVAIVAALQLSCSKIKSGYSTDVDWVYSIQYVFCDVGGAINYIYPGDSMGFASARIVYSGTLDEDNIFHIYLNDLLLGIQRFPLYNQYPGEYIPNVPNSLTVNEFYTRPEEGSSSLIFDQWFEQNDPKTGLYFCMQFPFPKRYEGTTPCDTMIINFFKLRE